MKYRDERKYHAQKMVKIALRDYRETKAWLEKEREAIIEGSSFQETCVQSGGTSDPTSSKALRLGHFRYTEADRQIKAIEMGMKALEMQRDKDYFNILRLKHIESSRSDNEIIQALNMSNRTLERKYACAIKLIVEYMGWIT